MKLDGGRSQLLRVHWIFVYLLRGHSDESLDRREQAIADYRKALSLNPDDGFSSEALKNPGAAAH
jgi:tetratricopeptide (TPR) repeat protein